MVQTKVFWLFHFYLFFQKAKMIRVYSFFFFFLTFFFFFKDWGRTFFFKLIYFYGCVGSSFLCKGFL